MFFCRLHQKTCLYKITCKRTHSGTHVRCSQRNVRSIGQYGFRPISALSQDTAKDGHKASNPSTPVLVPLRQLLLLPHQTSSARRRTVSSPTPTNVTCTTNASRASQRRNYVLTDLSSTIPRLTTNDVTSLLMWTAANGRNYVSYAESATCILEIQGSRVRILTSAMQLILAIQLIVQIHSECAILLLVFTSKLIFN